MNEQDIYYSLAGESEGMYKEKGSKFLAHAYPVTSEAEVKDKIDLLKKQYYDARHHCYAFILKPEEGREESYRANDDGEPSHSAGDPILGQIRSKELHDVLVVVVRYFGGTKLGVSGLVSAYKTAAADAITHNRIVRKVIRKPLSIRFPYAATNDVMQLIDLYQMQIMEQNFGADCQYQLAVARSQWQDAQEQFAKLAEVSLC
jgi:uncharacterized YigZ family protein